MADRQTVAKLLLADDHPIVLGGVEALLADSGFEVVSRCRNGEEALEQITATRPDIAILDVQMPRMTGIQVMRALGERPTRPKLVLLTASLTSSEAVEAIQFGVDGLVLKESASRELLHCVEKVLGGGRWIDPEASRQALDFAVTDKPVSPDAHATLTRRETQMIRLVTRGMRNKEIAFEMSITEGTVKMHLHNIYDKLGVGSRTELAMFARDNNIH